MKLVSHDSKISIEQLKQLASEMFGNLVKAVVDIQKEIMVIQAELHADEEALLLQNGSEQNNLWGINLYPEIGLDDEDFIEFDSMINLRPSQGNISRGVENPEIQNKLKKIVRTLVTP